MTFETWYAAECERLHALPDGQRESWCRAAWEAARDQLYNEIEASITKRVLKIIYDQKHGPGGSGFEQDVGVVCDQLTELIKGDNSVNTG